MKIQDTLYQYLEAHGLSQRDFCKQCKISEKALSCFLNGKGKGNSLAERIYPVLFDWLAQNRLDTQEERRGKNSVAYDITGANHEKASDK